MSELQIALLGAGAALVAGVWGYNLWQERRHKRLAEDIFKSSPPDVLLGGERQEERIEPAMAPHQSDTDARIEPVAQPVAEDDAEVAVVQAVPPTDEIADCTLRADLPEAVSAPTLWSLQAAWSESIGKPLRWFGFDTAMTAWRELTAHDAGRYVLIAAALQLADRQGAVNEAELTAFFSGVERLADQFDGSVDLPAKDDVLAHAQSLDQFCAGVDVQLSVNVVETAGGSFMGTKLRGVAEAAGLTLQDDGRFHACDDHGVELFVLGNLGPDLFDVDTLKTLATQGVTFVLDVPRVVQGPAAFDRMVAAARQIALALGGTMVDAQRHALSDPMIAGIRGKIGEIQQQMAANHIPPGSARALRLFS